jgi:hypothetical protein
MAAWVPETHASIHRSPLPAYDDGRPTAADLEALRPWSSVRVTPASGTTACLGMLVAMDLDNGIRRVGLGFAAKSIDARSAALREPAPTSRFANVHVVAEAPR